MAGQRAADHRRRRLPRLLPRPGRARTSTDRAAEASRSGVTVCDNFIRGAPAWLTALARHAESARSTRHDMHRAAARADAGLRVDHPRRRHRVADVLPQVPARDDGRQHQRPAQPARLLRRARRSTAAPVEGFLFFSQQRDLRRPRRRTAIPTPEDYRGNVSCTGPRACYDESKRFGETLCVNFAQQHGMPVKMARPFNNYGPGLEDHRRARASPTSRATCSPAATSSCSRTARRRAPSATSPTRSPATTRCWSRAAPASRTTSAPRRRRSRCASWPRRWSRPARRPVRLRGARSCTRSSPEADYLVDNPNRRCPIIEKARSAARLRPDDPRRRGPAPLADLVSPQPRRRSEA